MITQEEASDAQSSEASFLWSVLLLPAAKNANTKEGDDTMGITKNDTPIAGGYKRTIIKQHHGKYLARYMIINMARKKPYTKAEILADLRERQKQYPQFADLIKPWIEELERKVKQYPDAEFTLEHYATTKEKAVAELEKLQYRRLESLAKLLFRPLFERNLAYGDITLADFVLYQQDVLYAAADPDKRKRLLGCLHNVILPIIGASRLNQLDKKQMTKLIGKINDALHDEESKSTRCYYVRQAYQGLWEAIESSGWRKCHVGMRLVQLIKVSRDKNSHIRKNAQADHLDDNQRAALFHLLCQPEYEYELFLASFLYSGMDLQDMAAVSFGDIKPLPLKDTRAYAVLITKRARKRQTRYACLSVGHKDFSMGKFRRVVLYPWATNIFLQRQNTFLAMGFSIQQIQRMSLLTDRPSADKSDLQNRIQDAQTRLQRLMSQANIEDSAVTRTQKGQAKIEKIPADIQWLQWDAQYLARRIGADDVMLHAMFGQERVTVDEKSYLDFLGDRYAVARYQHMRRWNPLPGTPWPEDGNRCLYGAAHTPARHLLRVANNTDHPVTLTLSADYAILAYWELQKGGEP